MDKDNSSKSKITSANNDLVQSMKESFEFWQKTFEDSLVNYPLVWNKAVKSNSEIQKKIHDTWKKNSIQNAETQIQQFLELWSHAIRKSNFEIAKRSMQQWQEFWKNTTNEQFSTYAEILKMLELYWKNIQDKNIE